MNTDGIGAWQKELQSLPRCFKKKKERKTVEGRNRMRFELCVVDFTDLHDCKSLKVPICYVPRLYVVLSSSYISDTFKPICLLLFSVLNNNAQI